MFNKMRLLLLALTTVIFLANNLFASADTLESDYLIEVNNKLINIEAENVSFKKLLNELGEKAGIQVKVFDEVPDKQVSLSFSSLPLYAIDSILSEMGLEQTAIGYDASLSSFFVYVLPKGADIAQVTQGKALLQRADFAKWTSASQVKGKDFQTQEQNQGKYQIRYVKDELNLKFNLGTSQQEIDRILSENNLVAVKDQNPALTKLGYVKVKVTDERDLKEVAKVVRQDRHLKTSDFNYVANLMTVADPLYDAQWYIPEAKFDKAWEIAQSTEKVTVAVLDSGVDTTHPDLSGRILPGFDFVNGDDNAADDNGHGTFVAGLIAANANDIGIKGLYDYAQVLPVKVMDQNGLGTYEDVAAGIVYAADNGAKVINLSIGGYAYSFLLQDAIDYALEKGCVLVAAGGNDGIEQPVYPAAYPDVIGVAALGQDGLIWPGSNSGKHIEISAPGTNVVSAGLDGGFVYASGTSVSAPMVSVLLAAIAQNDASLSFGGIRQKMINGAVDAGEEGWDIVYGVGKVDAQSSLLVELESFCDLAVRGVAFESEELPTDGAHYLSFDIVNNGTAATCNTAAVVKVDQEGIEPYELQFDSYQVYSKISVAIQLVLESLPGKVFVNVKLESLDDTILANNELRIERYVRVDQTGLIILYSTSPPVHQWIALQAYEKLKEDPRVSQAFKDEIGKYIAKEDTVYYMPFFDPTNLWRIGDDPENSPVCNVEEGNCYTLLEGVEEEDVSPKPLNHFWEPNKGFKNGLETIAFETSAVDRAGEILWESLDAYNEADDMPLAYYLLGNTSHLLMDMSVPSHVHADSHLYLGDFYFDSRENYEWYTGYSSSDYSPVYKEYKYANNKQSTAIPEVLIEYGDIPNDCELSYDWFDLRYVNIPYPVVSCIPEIDLEAGNLFFNLAVHALTYDADDASGTIDNGRYNSWSGRVELSDSLRSVIT